MTTEEARDWVNEHFTSDNTFDRTFAAQAIARYSPLQLSRLSAGSDMRYWVIVRAWLAKHS